MLTDRIIGRVGADILAKRISNPGQPGDSAALFRLDKLSSSQIAAVARAILANPDLLARVDLMIPEALVDSQGLPPEILISHNAGYVRNNATTTKAAILTANGNEHNLADTLGHVMAIGAKEMRADPEPWVEAALHAGGLSPVPDDRSVFLAALGGLLASSDLSLVQLGEFCSEIVDVMSTRGLAIRDAVGFAMPRAGLPRDSAFFSNAKSFGSLRKPWQKAFAKLFTQRAPLLKKLRQNGQPLDPEELGERIEANAAEIAEAARLALDAFAAAPAGDQEAASALAQFEWEADGVYLAFDKPKEKQLGLANFDGSRASLEGILSLAAEKPPRDWVDRHIDAAILELAKFARRFREAEAFVAVQGRKAHSEAIAVVIGAGSDTKTISRSFAISDRHRKTVEAKADEVASMLEGQGLGTEVLLAILAKAGMKLASIDKDASNG